MSARGQTRDLRSGIRLRGPTFRIFRQPVALSIRKVPTYIIKTRVLVGIWHRHDGLHAAIDEAEGTGNNRSYRLRPLKGLPFYRGRSDGH